MHTVARLFVVCELSDDSVADYWLYIVSQYAHRLAYALEMFTAAILVRSTLWVFHNLSVAHRF